MNKNIVLTGELVMVDETVVFFNMEDDNVLEHHKAVITKKDICTSQMSSAELNDIINKYKDFGYRPKSMNTNLAMASELFHVIQQQLI